jgi:hypothetical protein
MIFDHIFILIGNTNFVPAAGILPAEPVVIVNRPDHDPRGAGKASRWTRSIMQDTKIAD